VAQQLILQMLDESQNPTQSLLVSALKPVNDCPGFRHLFALNGEAAFHYYQVEL